MFNVRNNSKYKLDYILPDFVKRNRGILRSDNMQFSENDQVSKKHMDY